VRRFAIIGATGHIGASLASLLASRDCVSLALYARRPDRVRALAAKWVPRAVVTVHALENEATIDLADCDVVINALGLADPAAVAAVGDAIIGLTLDWEERLRSALRACPEALYVYLSSGAVYGPLVDGPARADARVSFAANGMAPSEAYGRAKFMAETMHRGWSHRRILDIRVFGFVSAAITTSDGFFLSELFLALAQGTPFSTGSHDLVRDYVGPQEILALIDCAAASGTLNEAVDIYSASPVRKFEIIEALRDLGLVCNIASVDGPPTTRRQYFTTMNRASQLGYLPHRTAREIVVDAAHEFLSRQREGHA
jgi:nucleoside-diphosphate-sugar epimerase